MEESLGARQQSNTDIHIARARAQTYNWQRERELSEIKSYS